MKNLHKKEMKVGDRLREFMRVKNQTEIGAYRTLGISRQLFQKYISNQTANIMQSVSDRLHELGCNLNWLYTGNGEMYNNTEEGQDVKEKIENMIVNYFNYLPEENKIVSENKIIYSTNKESKQ